MLFVIQLGKTNQLASHDASQAGPDFYPSLCLIATC